MSHAIVLAGILGSIGDSRSEGGESFAVFVIGGGFSVSNFILLYFIYWGGGGGGGGGDCCS